MSARVSTGRRLRFAFMAAALILGTTASAVLATLIAQRKAVRFDVTQTRMHHLADRTLSLLADLDDGYEIVLAFNARATDRWGRLRVDRRARQRTDDVLQEMLRVRPDLASTSIDTGSAEGSAAYEALLRRLIDREGEAIDAHAQTVRTAAEELAQAAQAMRGTIPERLGRLAATIVVTDAITQTLRAGIEDQAQRVVRLAAQLEQPAQDAMTKLTRPESGLWLPESAELAATLPTQLGVVSTNLDALADELRTAVAADTTLGDSTRALARELARALEQLRNAAMVRADELRRLRPLDLHRIRRALTSGEVVLVIGPAGVGVTAVDFAAMFPSTDLIDATTGMQTDLRRRAEELLTSALGSLSSPLKPIVVFTHAEAVRGVTDPRVFGTAAKRLELRGMDVLEWAIALDPLPPDLVAVDPAGERPVVWIFHDAASWESSRNEGSLSGPAKATELGRAMGQVLERGGSMLVSCNPSVLPGYGQADPTVAVLGAFGLEASSGRAMLREGRSGGQRTITPDFRIHIAESEHPISGAVSGLPIWMSWPVSVRAATEGDAPGAEWWPLATIEAGDTGASERVWGESEWLAMRRTPEAQRGFLTNLPAFDAERDDGSGPWVVIAAAQRPSPAGLGEQRLVYVGTNGWFVRNVLLRSQEIDGRLVSVYPGNVELLEASVYWLAGQDRMIARSATAQAIPLVRMLSGAQLRTINLGLIGVLPALVLLMGIGWRVLRG